MDPYSSSNIVPKCSPHNPFPHSLLRTRQKTLNPKAYRFLFHPLENPVKGTPFPTKNQTASLSHQYPETQSHKALEWPAFEAAEPYQGATIYLF